MEVPGGAEREHDERARDGARRRGERELALHGGRLRGSLPRDARAAPEPGQRPAVRRGRRRGAVAAGAGGGGLLVVPLLQPRGAGPQAGAQPHQLQGPARRAARPHRRPRAPPRDAGVRRGIRRRLRVLDDLHGDGRADPAWYPGVPHGPRRR